MTREEKIKMMEELGILNIESYGELSDEIIDDAISLVKKQNEELDFKAIAKRADEAEK